jgi:hypothetical protein
MGAFAFIYTGIHSRSAPERTIPNPRIQFHNVYTSVPTRFFQKVSVADWLPSWAM